MRLCKECGKKVGGFDNYGQPESPLCFDCANKTISCTVCGKTYTRINNHQCRSTVETANLPEERILIPGPTVELYKNGAPVEIRRAVHPTVAGLFLFIAGTSNIVWFSLLLHESYSYGTESNLLYTGIFCGISLLVLSLYVLSSVKNWWAILLNGTIQITDKIYTLTDFELIEEADYYLKFIHPGKKIKIPKRALKASDLNDLICIISTLSKYKRV